MDKKLYRSKDNRILAGIIGGIGEYLKVDPVILRLLFVVFTIFTGIVPGIILYVIAMVIVPEHPETSK